MLSMLHFVAGGSRYSSVSSFIGIRITSLWPVCRLRVFAILFSP